MARPATRLRSVFELDLRSLAAMRIGLGFLIVLDLINRARSFTAHYTDAGVLPGDVLTGEFERSWQLSLHLVSSPILVAGLFVVAGIVGLMLMVGYRTRIATVVSWVLMLSLHTRNPWVLQGGDDLFRMLLFWGMFLPLGARWSVDSIRRPEPDRPVLLFDMATVALIAQVVFVYMFATMSKLSHRVWWPDGMGVYYALSVEQFTTRIGLALLSWPGLLKFLSFATLIIQGLVPLLLLAPVWRDRIRAYLPPVMIAMHLGFALTLNLGLFSAITCVMWLSLLPPRSWSWLGERLPKWKLTAKLTGRWESLVDRLRDRLGPAEDSENEDDEDDEDDDKHEAASEPRRRLMDRTAVRWAFALMITYSLWWNLWRADRIIYRMPASVEELGRVVRLEQRWKMFSSPPKWNQWYSFAGLRADGSKVDVWTGGEVTFDKPDLVSSTFRNQRWRKYLTNLARNSGKPHRKHLANYLCRAWNSEHSGDQAINRVQLVRMRQGTPRDPRQKRNPADTVVLGTFNCPTD